MNTVINKLEGCAAGMPGLEESIDLAFHGDQVRVV
jgi:hypothetical protein